MIAAVAKFSLAVLPGAHGLPQLPFLRCSRQNPQCQLVAIVHTIFPEPVVCIEHSRVIASFQKVNLSMGSWAVNRYLRGAAVHAAATADRHGLPLAVTTPAAKHHAATLEQLTLDFSTIGAKPGNLVGHRACHSDKLEIRFANKAPR